MKVTPKSEIESLRRQMESAAAALRFEEAACLRDRITAKERSLEPREIKAKPVGKPLTDVGSKFRLLERLQHQLRLHRIPHRIECFDVSHFHGEMIVASKAAMTEGKIDKDRYRRYRIKTVTVGDDTAAMFEAVTRRMKHGIIQKDLPDLIVLDGGKPQLSAGIAAIRTLGITEVDMVALAKKKERGLPNKEESAKTPERIFIPGKKESIVLPQTSPELLLLVQLRDEAHRFAITYQKNLSHREMLRSELDDIPGIGEKRKKTLLSRFGSVSAIAKASLEELSGTEGIGPAAARRIYDFFRRKDQNNA